MVVERNASLPVIQRDARSSWSSTQLCPTRGVAHTAQDNSVLDNAVVLIDAFLPMTSFRCQFSVARTLFRQQKKKPPDKAAH